MAAINWLFRRWSAESVSALRTIPVLSPKLLEQSQLDAFHAVDIGQGVLTQEELLEHRLPEMPSALVPLLEEFVGRDRRQVNKNATRGETCMPVRCSGAKSGAGWLHTCWHCLHWPCLACSQPVWSVV